MAKAKKVRNSVVTQLKNQVKVLDDWRLLSKDDRHKIRHAAVAATKSLRSKPQPQAVK